MQLPVWFFTQVGVRGFGMGVGAAGQVCVRKRACRGLQNLNKKTLYERRLNLCVYECGGCFLVLQQCDIVSYHTLAAGLFRGVAVGGRGVSLDQEDVKGLKRKKEGEDHG